MRKQLISSVPKTLHNVTHTELGFDGNPRSMKRGAQNVLMGFNYLFVLEDWTRT